MFHLIAVTQTPLVRFKISVEELVKRFGQSPFVEVKELREGLDYIVSPGGVTRMVYPFLKKLVDLGDSPWWVSLNPQAPRFISIDGIRIYNVSVPSIRIKGYGFAKEIIWGVLHRIDDSSSKAQELMWVDEYVDYIYYNRKVAQSIEDLDREEDFDIIYIHDFQHIPLGSMLTLLKPKIFRWHIPIERELIPESWLPSMELYLSKYDAIIVSSNRYVNPLRELGYRGSIHVLYPYIDPKQYATPNKEDIEKFSEKFGLKPDDRVILVVARMDPMKGQDRAIKALKLVKHRIPEAKLVLVGDGSFSSSKNGVGLSKGERWAGYLSSLARELGVEDSVIMTGYVTQRELEAAYSRADLVLLPSIVEGFGLAVVEGWLYKKPSVVSSRAGVSDLIINGYNGVLIDPDDIEGIAKAITEILSSDSYAQELGYNGYETSKKCYSDAGIKAEIDLINSIIG